MSYDGKNTVAKWVQEFNADTLSRSRSIAAAFAADAAATRVQAAHRGKYGRKEVAARTFATSNLTTAFGDSVRMCTR